MTEMLWAQPEPLTIVLLIALLVAGVLIGRMLGFRQGYDYFERKILSKRLEASRSTLKGQIGEHIVPFLPGFKHKPSECRFIGKPVDFLVFKGLDDGEVKEVVFLEVKTGKAQETRVEKSLRDAIRNKSVSWDLYRAPGDLTD